MSKERVKQALEVMLTDLGSNPAMIEEYFHPDYIQLVDGKMLDFKGFVAHLHSLREKVDRLELVFERLFGEGDHVCSLHRVNVAKKDGTYAQIKVIAYFQLSGDKIILCDELTRVLSGDENDAELGSS